MQALFSIAMQATAVLLLAPLIKGINRKVKAMLQGRQGAGVLQPYYELVKLIKKTQ